jgi:hypothetical protein
MIKKAIITSYFLFSCSHLYSKMENAQTFEVGEIVAVRKNVSEVMCRNKASKNMELSMTYFFGECVTTCNV